MSLLFNILLIHVAVQQKLAQHYKAIIFQLKKLKKEKKTLVASFMSDSDASILHILTHCVSTPDGWVLSPSGFYRASLVAQMVRSLPAVRETWV